MTLSDFKAKSLLIGSISIGILVIGIVLIVLLIPEPQDTRREAADPAGTVELDLTPKSIQLTPGGEKQTVTVNLNSKGREFSTVRLTIKYPVPATGTPPIIASNLRASGLTAQAGWTCSFTEEPTIEAGQYRIVMQNCAIGAGSTQKASTANFTEIMKFDIEAAEGAAAQTISLTFDANESRVTGRISDTASGDIAAIPAAGSATQVTIGAAGTPPPDDTDEEQVSFGLTPSSLSLAPGASQTLTMQLNTNGLEISTFGTELYYDLPADEQGPPAAPKITFSDAKMIGLPLTKQGWTCASEQLNPQVTGNRYRIGISCFSGSGATQLIASTTPTDVFSVNITAAADTSARSTTLRIDPEKTIATIYVGAQSVNVAEPPTATVALTVPATGGATPTPSPTATPTPTPTPSSSSSTSTTAPGSVACNASCSSNRDCSDNRSCISGKCRDSRCPDDGSCKCETTNPGADAGTLPESGFNQTLAFTLLGMIFLLGGAQLFAYMRKPVSQ